MFERTARGIYFKFTACFQGDGIRFLKIFFRNSLSRGWSIWKFENFNLFEPGVSWKYLLYSFIFFLIPKSINCMSLNFIFKVKFDGVVDPRHFIRRLALPPPTLTPTGRQQTHLQAFQLTFPQRKNMFVLRRIVCENSHSHDNARRQNNHTADYIIDFHNTRNICRRFRGSSFWAVSVPVSLKWASVLNYQFPVNEGSHYWVMHHYRSV